MNASEHTLQQIERALRKAASKFPENAENMPLTDIYLQVKQDSGELLIFDDDFNELTRCVIEEWIGNSDENFYEEIEDVLRSSIEKLKDVVDNLSVLKPYSFVLAGEDRETIADLYLVDDDLIVLDGELMHGLDEELDNFWDELSKK